MTICRTSRPTERTSHKWQNTPQKERKFSGKLEAVFLQIEVSWVRVVLMKAAYSLNASSTLAQSMKRDCAGHV